MQIRSFNSQIEHDASEAPITRKRSFGDISILKQVERGGCACTVRTRLSNGKLGIYYFKDISLFKLA